MSEQYPLCTKHWGNKRLHGPFPRELKFQKETKDGDELTHYRPIFWRQHNSNNRWSFLNWDTYTIDSHSWACHSRFPKKLVGILKIRHLDEPLRVSVELWIPLPKGSLF